MKTNDIINLFEDEKSKLLFKSKYNYVKNETAENLKSVIENGSKLISSLPFSLDLEIENINFLSKFPKDEPIIFYGMSREFMFLYMKTSEILKDYNIIFCDKRADVIKSRRNRPVISPEELFAKYRDNIICITTRVFYKEIYDYLIENNINVDNIYKTPIFDLENQFFSPILELSSEEVFFDVGALTGFHTVKGKEYFKEVHLFESKYFHDTIKKEMEGHEIKNYSMHDVFLQDVTKTDVINGIEENLETLDNYLNHNLSEKNVTFMKIDLEGNELQALKGATETIKRNKPKLAIHLPCDLESMVAIPEFLKEIVPSYKLYLDHYSTNEKETVLYATL